MHAYFFYQFTIFHQDPMVNCHGESAEHRICLLSDHAQIQSDCFIYNTEWSPADTQCVYDIICSVTASMASGYRPYFQFFVVSLHSRIYITFQ